MLGLSLAGWVGLFILSCAAALVVLWLIGVWPGPAARKEMPDETRESHFLFNGNRLVDHDVADLPDDGSGLGRVETWADLRAWLSPRFEKLPKDLDSPGAPNTVSFVSRNSHETLSLARKDGQTRVTLRLESRPSAVAWHDALCAAQDAICARDILDASPYPAWRSDDHGSIVWRNAACDNIADGSGQLPVGSPNATTRFSIDADAPNGPAWYEMHSMPTANGQIHHASDITQVIRAETVQREFVQTLTKTFANLTTGLAIFDRNRQLALFNPALVDLTNLPVTFLSARPGLIPFFDELRERQILPEPKSYATWRAQIRDVVEQANDDAYNETWSLPTGLTYRVNGRPHPDGAIAFLFEDISADISLTRRFRAQIDLSHSVLDNMDDAIAVIGSNGLLTFCNRACSGLLKIDPDRSFADMTPKDLLAICRERFKPDSCWSAFEHQLVAHPSGVVPPVRLTLIDGSVLESRIKSLPGGAQMLCLRPLGETNPSATPMQNAAV